MSNKLISKFKIMDHVRLEPPAAQVVSITFQAGPTGVIEPFYGVLVEGKRVDNIPERDIIGLDTDAIQREREARAARNTEEARRHNTVTPITGAVREALAAPLPGDDTFGKFGEPMPDAAQVAAEAFVEAEHTTLEADLAGAPDEGHGV